MTIFPSPQFQRPDWLESAVFYEIYPQSFYDTNGDGIGDLPGITAKLDYLSQLGVTALWLNPIFDSPFKDAGYDVRDYYTIAQRYGSHSDFKELLVQAHMRDIRVLLDLVPGHTSEQHPWFQHSAQVEPNEYSDRYIWTSHAFDNGAGLPFIGGEYDRNGTYILNFFKSQPALNYGFNNKDRPWQQDISDAGPMENRKAMVEVMRYWLSLGCDGFRVDMADSLVKFDGDDKPCTITVWQDIFAQVRSEFPDAAFVSEWGKPWQALDAGFDMDFYLDWPKNGYNLLLRDTDDHFGGTDSSYFAADSDTPADAFFSCYLPQESAARERSGFFSLISGNHDTPRVAPRLTEAERKLFFLFLLTMPGVPFIYYGDEIGMRYLDVPTTEGGYARTGSRSPMQWDSQAENFGFSTAEADKLYISVDPDPDAPSVDKQIGVSESMLETVRSFIALRRKHIALQASAGFERLHTANPRCMAYRRLAGTQEITVIINPGSTQVTESASQGWPLVTLGGATITDMVVTLPPTSAVVISHNHSV